MKYKILKAPFKRWGEGWQVGDIVEMDAEAARVSLIDGEIEPSETPTMETLEVEKPKKRK